MKTESKAYKRLLDAAVEAADRLQRCTLKLDREAGNKLLKALLDFDGEHVAFPSVGKSDPDTAVAVADRRRAAAQAARGSATPAPAPAACNRLQAPPVAGQI